MKNFIIRLLASRFLDHLSLLATEIWVRGSGTERALEMRVTLVAFYRQDFLFFPPERSW